LHGRTILAEETHGQRDILHADPIQRAGGVRLRVAGDVGQGMDRIRWHAFVIEAGNRGF
jgi:hypothetical protein